MFIRSKYNPILIPDPKTNWRSKKIYNPTILFEKNIYHLFWRAVGDDGISRIGYARSKNAENFDLPSGPIFEPSLEKESKGVEDPRITVINKRYFLTYTGYDGFSARLFLSISDDLINWQKYGRMIYYWDLIKAKGFVVPWDRAQQNEIAKKEWHKAGGIFPEKIDNKFYMLFGDRNIWLATSDDGIEWQAIFNPFIKPRKDYFDSVHVEMGPAPIKTDKGWLVLYHGIDIKMTYRLGYLILDLKNPNKIIYRSDNPIFEPQADYELTGTIDITNDNGPKVIFCNGAVLVENCLRIYYGAGDSTVCTATAPLDKILPKSL